MEKEIKEKKRKKLMPFPFLEDEVTGFEAVATPVLCFPSLPSCSPSIPLPLTNILLFEYENVWLQNK